MSAGIEFCYYTFIRFVKVYTDKIEIGLNYGFNTPGDEKEPVVRKISTETYETTRLFKGGTVKTTYRNYDVYVVV